MKKFISVLLSLCLVLSCVLSCGVSVSASVEYRVYSDLSVNAVAGEMVSVPVYISGNQGLMGFDLYITYDSGVLTPYLPPSSDYSATAGDALTGGSLTDDVGGSEFVDGTVRVCWYHSSQIDNNGTLFNLQFIVNSQATGSTVLAFDHTKSEAYNGDFGDVVLTFEDITVAVQNNEYDGKPVFLLQAKNSISAGEQLNIDILAENIGNMSTVKLTVPYDSNNFKYSGMTVNGVTATATDSGSNVAIIISSFTNKTDGKKITLKFQSEAFATSGKYSFLATYSNLSGVDRILVKGTEIIVSATESSDTIVVYTDDVIKTEFGEQQLIVPLYIKHNTGLIGYTLTFEYDPEILEAVSATPGNAYKKNFINTIEKKEAGKFTCLWFGDDDVTANGDFITLTFNVLTNQKVNGQISISYHKNDIISESIDGVKISIPEIKYSLNEGFPLIRGDSDGDGEITILDATIIQRYLASFVVCNPERVEQCGDVNGDGVDIIDATCIQRYLAAFTDPYHIGEIME